MVQVECLQALQTFQQLDDVCEISEPDGRRQIYHGQMFDSKEIVVGWIKLYQLLPSDPLITPGQLTMDIGLISPHRMQSSPPGLLYGLVGDPHKPSFATDAMKKNWTIFTNKNWVPDFLSSKECEENNQLGNHQCISGFLSHISSPQKNWERGGWKKKREKHLTNFFEFTKVLPAIFPKLWKFLSCCCHIWKHGWKNLESLFPLFPNTLEVKSTIKRMSVPWNCWL